MNSQLGHIYVVANALSRLLDIIELIGVPNQTIDVALFQVDLVGKGQGLFIDMTNAWNPNQHLKTKASKKQKPFTIQDEIIYQMD
jgi:hypothetical protein